MHINNKTYPSSHLQPRDQLEYITLFTSITMFYGIDDIPWNIIEHSQINLIMNECGKYPRIFYKILLVHKTLLWI